MNIATSRYYGTLNRVIGFVLVGTVVLKLGLLLFDPFADTKAGFPLSVLWAATFVEILLAWANLTRRPSVRLWLLDAGFFSLVLVISTARWVAGHSTCGCTGSVEIPAWGSVAFNALTLLALSRGSSSILRQLPTPKWKVVAESDTLPCYAGVLAACLVFAYYLPIVQRPNSAGVVTTENIDLGELSMGEKVTTTVALSNASNRAIRIVGGGRSCACVSSNQVGSVLPPSQATALEVEITPTRVGRLHQRLVYFLDLPEQFSVSVDIFAFVTKGDEV